MWQSWYCPALLLCHHSTQPKPTQTQDMSVSTTETDLIKLTINEVRLLLISSAPSSLLHETLPGIMFSVSKCLFRWTHGSLWRPSAHQKDLTSTLWKSLFPFCLDKLILWPTFNSNSCQTAETFLVTFTQSDDLFFFNRTQMAKETQKERRRLTSHWKY